MPSISTATTRFVCRECLPAGEYLPHVQFFIDRYLDRYVSHQVFQSACENGASNDLLKYFLEHCTPDWKQAVNAAARGGHRHVLEWTLAERQDGWGLWPTDFAEGADEAVRSGRFEMLQFLHNAGIGEFSYRTMGLSASFVCLEMVYQNLPEPQSESERREEMEASDYLVFTTIRSNLHTSMQWLIEKDPKLDVCTALQIFRKHDGKNDANVVWWLNKHDRVQLVCKVLREGCSGQQEVLAWIFEHIAFEDSTSRDVIRKAIERAPGVIAQWLAANIRHEDFHNWCFESERSNPERRKRQRTELLW